MDTRICLKMVITKDVDEWSVRIETHLTKNRDFASPFHRPMYILVHREISSLTRHPRIHLLDIRDMIPGVQLSLLFYINNFVFILVNFFLFLALGVCSNLSCRTVIVKRWDDFINKFYNSHRFFFFVIVKIWFFFYLLFYSPNSSKCNRCKYQRWTDMGSWEHRWVSLKFFLHNFTHFPRNTRIDVRPKRFQAIISMFQVEPPVRLELWAVVRSVAASRLVEGDTIRQCLPIRCLGDALIGQIVSYFSFMTVSYRKFYENDQIL